MRRKKRKSAWFDTQANFVRKLFGRNHLITILTLKYGYKLKNATHMVDLFMMYLKTGYYRKDLGFALVVNNKSLTQAVHYITVKRLGINSDDLL